MFRNADHLAQLGDPGHGLWRHDPATNAQRFQSRQRSSTRHPYRATGANFPKRRKVSVFADAPILDRARASRALPVSFICRKLVEGYRIARVVSCVPSAVDAENYDASLNQFLSKFTRFLHQPLEDRLQAQRHLCCSWSPWCESPCGFRQRLVSKCARCRGLLIDLNRFLCCLYRSSNALTGHIAQDRNMTAQGG